MEDLYLSPWADDSDGPILSIDALTEIQLEMGILGGFSVSKLRNFFLKAPLHSL
jgi:hypothetical protein